MLARLPLTSRWAPPAPQTASRRFPALARSLLPAECSGAKACESSIENLDSVESGVAADRDPPPPSRRLDAIPPPLLKALRRQGLQMKDAIKLGRLGVGDGMVEQIRRRWNTSEVGNL